VGNAVRVSAIDPDEFHRTPTYLRGAVGRIAYQCGSWCLPKGRGTHSADDDPQPVYTVEFQLAHLFGAQHGDARIFADLWATYLEEADLGDVSR
jgi:hypothetical protein